MQRWRSSGLTAAEFAGRERLSLWSLRWWSSAVSRDTRALHGPTATRPIEIAVASASARAIEVAVGGAVVRFEAGVDVGYVASLIRAMSER